LRLLERLPLSASSDRRPPSRPLTHHDAPRRHV